MKYRMDTYEDFKKILKNKEATAVFFSRQLFEETMPGEMPNPENPDLPPIQTKQLVLTGYLVISAENREGDVFRYLKLLPPYPTDRKPETLAKIREAIGEEELTIIKELEAELKRKPIIYNGEIEDKDKQASIALGQIANALGGVEKSISTVANVIYTVGRPEPPKPRVAPIVPQLPPASEPPEASP